MSILKVKNGNIWETVTSGGGSGSGSGNTGGTFTGAITFEGNIILSSASYGTTLPAAGVPGRIFFLKQST